jgi:hypothetical protein
MAMYLLMSRYFSWAKTMPLSTKLVLMLVVLLCAPLATAQSNLGELLDAGAKKLTVEEFKNEVAQRVIVGPTATGGKLELLYAHTGVIQGLGTYMDVTSQRLATISGEWTTDDNGRVCTSMTIGGGVTAMMLPPRCQFWFKYAEQYFLSDSDSDRKARVLRRTLKQ